MGIVLALRPLVNCGSRWRLPMIVKWRKDDVFCRDVLSLVWDADIIVVAISFKRRVLEARVFCLFHKTCGRGVELFEGLRTKREGVVEVRLHRFYWVGIIC